MSTRTKDYIFDAMALGQSIKMLEYAIFQNSDILKVMHGASQDVKWLQCDYGIHIINLFDTGQAARLLELPSFGLAFATAHYCQVDVSELKFKYQNCDWRERPLTPGHLQYARDDTHYLLYIYDLMRNELVTKGQLSQAQQCSRYITLELYQPPQAIGSDAVREFEDRLKWWQQQQRTKQLPHPRKLCTQVFVGLNAWRYLRAEESDESVEVVASQDFCFEVALLLPTAVEQLMCIQSQAHDWSKAGQWAVEILHVVDSKVNPVEELMVTKETDPSRLHQRQKQIDLGKGTPEYQEYIKRIPKENRSRKHVRTPDPTQIRSKRAWDGIVKQWRRALHQWAREAGVE
eukprot:TRINITY_DN16931_c0_g1_i9.p1 TRINITY_DN16931_c0_g1~~TRINITY_DN16931_c0_g1_i9.p1  ORF type:complete len:346 (+),score=55.65 TRINITY_DN16931_c0_g1_i9:302-1339(+)